MDQTIAKYLQRYAEPEAELASSLKDRYRCAIVVPAYRETAQDIQGICADLDDSTGVLMVLVINSADADEPSGCSLRDALCAAGPVSLIAEGMALCRRQHQPDLLVIDRFSEGRTVSSKAGVGLARKIGADVALALYAAGRLESPWLFNTDADARLPADYLEPGDREEDAVAIIYPFIHDRDGARNAATLLYEISMLYYAAGLGWAGSPYAYTTVGSTLCIHLAAYARVRGFPKRNTGEDFYLLNKMRKLGSIHCAARTPVRLSARPSDRVPIGTGRAVRAISELGDPLSEYRLEHPACFQQLRKLQLHLAHIAQHQPENPYTADPSIDSYIDNSGLLEAYRTKLKTGPSAKVMRRHLSDWFDGLRTRQFIHHQRDQVAGEIAISGLPLAPFLDLDQVDQRNLPAAFDQLQALVYH